MVLVCINFFLFSQSECSFLYMGPTFIHEKVVLPEYLRARNVLQYEYIKGKLPQQMSDVISLDNEQFRKIFHKTSMCSPTAKFVKCDNVWVYAPSHCCFFSDVRINEILEWGIAPEKGTAIHLQSCSKIKHGEHDFLAPFQFSNAELLAFYERIATGHDENRKRAIAERYDTLKVISNDPSIGHENTCFHIDWTVRLFYSI